MKNNEIYDRFFSVWGYEAQARVAIEEMSELIKELCKLERNRGNSEKEQMVIEHIKEEVADVLNMVDQLAYYFGQDEVNKIREQKTLRTIKRLETQGDNNER